MKQETEELIEWITSVLAYCPYNVLPDFLGVNADEKLNLAISFLCSLPEIEAHLCKGGYIQDRNGTPCCDGDNVKFGFTKTEFTKHFRDRYGESFIGVLKWNTEMRAFFIEFGDKGDWIDFTCSNDGIEWFEKVK